MYPKSDWIELQRLNANQASASWTHMSCPAWRRWTPAPRCCCWSPGTWRWCARHGGPNLQRRSRWPPCAPQPSGQCCPAEHGHATMSHYAKRLFSDQLNRRLDLIPLWRTKNLSENTSLRWSRSASQSFASHPDGVTDAVGAQLEPHLPHVGREDPRLLRRNCIRRSKSISSYHKDQTRGRSFVWSWKSTLEESFLPYNIKEDLQVPKIKIIFLSILEWAFSSPRSRRSQRKWGFH